jgi:hypothetical protein
MMAVANRRLRHLGNQRLGEAQRQVLQLPAEGEFAFQHAGAQAVAVTRALNHRTAGSTLAAHEQGDSDQAFVTGDGDFGRGAAFHHIEQRDDTGGGKVHVTLVAAGFIDRPAQRHCYRLEVGQQARVVNGRQRSDQIVLLG